jgi:hypothetical protein
MRGPILALALLVPAVASGVLWLVSHTGVKAHRKSSRSIAAAASERYPGRQAAPRLPVPATETSEVSVATMLTHQKDPEPKKLSLNELSEHAEREPLDPRWSRETEARIVTRLRTVELPKGVAVESVRCGNARCVLRVNGEKLLLKESQQQVLDAIQLPRGRIWMKDTPSGKQLVIVSAREGFDVMGEPTGTVP